MSRALAVPAQRPFALPQRLAPLGASALVVGWALLMAGTHPAQFADSIEEYNWAHSLEWGYWKHPPLATWLMRGAIALLGVSHWTAPLLAMACLVASVWFVWGVARELLPARAANLATVLWPLHHALTWRAEVYNHNTVLVLVTTAIAWTGLRAWRLGRLRDWLAFGLAAGLGVLGKYQAFVTIAGVVLALGGCGALRDARTRRGLAAAGALAAGLVLPHAVWAISHALPTLSYLEKSAPPLPLPARVPKLLRFFGAQLTMLATLLVAAAAARWLPSRSPAPADALPAPMAERALRAWMIGLVALPFAVVALAVLGGGFTPQKMWGIHTTLFLPLWLAAAIDRARADGDLAGRAALAAVVLTVANASYAIHELRESHHEKPHSADSLMPAGELARAALADWHAATACPLRIVSGNAFPAGLVSVYSGTYATVLEDDDFTKTPWVTPADVQAFGRIEVHGPMPPSQVPPGVASMRVPAPRKFAGEAAMWWRVHPPATPC